MSRTFPVKYIIELCNNKVDAFTRMREHYMDINEYGSADVVYNTIKRIEGAVKFLSDSNGVGEVVIDVETYLLIK